MKTHYCFGSHLGFLGDTPIDLTCERLQAPWRALALREKALDSTPSARIVEHVSEFYENTLLSSRVLCCKHYISMYLDEYLTELWLSATKNGHKKYLHSLNPMVLALICNIFQNSFILLDALHVRF